MKMSKLLTLSYINAIIFQSLVPIVREHNIDTVRGVEKIRRIIKVERIEKVRVVEKAIREII